MPLIWDLILPPLSVFHNDAWLLSLWIYFPGFLSHNWKGKTIRALKSIWCFIFIQWSGCQLPLIMFALSNVFMGWWVEKQKEEETSTTPNSLMPYISSERLLFLLFWDSTCLLLLQYLFIVKRLLCCQTSQIKNLLWLI